MARVLENLDFANHESVDSSGVDVSRGNPNIPNSYQYLLSSARLSFSCLGERRIHFRKHIPLGDQSAARAKG